MAFPENKAFWEARVFAESHRCSQETAENRRKLQKPQIGICSLRFVPMRAALDSEVRKRDCQDRGWRQTGPKLHQKQSPRTVFRFLIGR